MMKGSSPYEHFLDRSLTHVMRFSSIPQQFQESVAEHSFYVAYFTSILIYFLKKEGVSVREDRALKIALIHDMEEKFSGDILTPFKYYSQELYQAIRKVNRETVPLVFEHLPKPLAKNFIALWKEDVDRKTKEAQVVKVADKLSLLSKCREEMSLGNAFFKPIYDRELEALRHLEWPWWQKIKNDVLPATH
ncbi:MAG: HD domain-containing protein [Candidatus Colwellbacteria bacterium]|nr:HD domain-containing protein [Candidatus Colwellbacteria bacterium]